MKPILKIEDLVVEYRTREVGEKVQVAVNHLSLEIFPGEVFGFLGPNGAGKTTTMNVLLGFVPATRGAAYIFDVNVPTRGFFASPAAKSGRASPRC